MPTENKKIKFIVFEGPDSVGKSSLLKSVANGPYQHVVKEIKFKKTLPSGDLLRISTEKDFELLFSAFELFYPNKVYLLDRFIVSNLVYDKHFRNLDTSISQHYYKEFKERFDVFEVFGTREYIGSNFEDDRIKIPKDVFNNIIDEYKKYNNQYELIKLYESGVIAESPKRFIALSDCHKFISKICF